MILRNDFPNLRISYILFRSWFLPAIIHFSSQSAILIIAITPQSQICFVQHDLWCRPWLSSSKLQSTMGTRLWDAECWQWIWEMEENEMELGCQYSRTSLYQGHIFYKILTKGIPYENAHDRHDLPSVVFMFCYENLYHYSSRHGLKYWVEIYHTLL